MIFLIVVYLFMRIFFIDHYYFAFTNPIRLKVLNGYFYSLKWKTELFDRQPTSRQTFENSWLCYGVMAMEHARV